MDCNGDTVRPSIVPVLGRVHHTVGEKDPDGDAELVPCHQRATDFPRGDLRHIQNDDGGDEAHAGTGNQATHHHHRQTGRGSLEDTAHGENEAAGNDGHSATNKIGNVTGNDGAKKGTGG